MPVKKIRRWRKRLLICGSACVLVVLTLYLLRNLLFAGMLRDYIARSIAASSDSDVQIGSLSGSWLSDIELRDITLIANSADNPLQRLSVKNASASYSFFSLLNGFDASDLGHLEIIDLDVKLISPEHPQFQATGGTAQQNSFDPALIATYSQQRIPSLKINGHLEWQEKSSTNKTFFILSGDNNRLELHTRETIIKNMEYSLGPVILERIDLENFRINGSQFHEHLALNNGNVHITPNSIDARIPLTIAQQPQTLLFHYTKQRQHLECNLDIQWHKTPNILRSIIPQLLPQKGRSRIIASIHNSSRGFDLTCMVHADDLLWNIDDKIFKASLHAFVQNNGEECTIEINDVAFYAPAHHALINNRFNITSSDHKLWQVEETKVQTKSGTVSIGGTLSMTDSDFSMSWNALDLGIISQAFEYDGLTGLCDGSIYIGGNLYEPNINLKVEAPKLTLEGSPFTVNLSCSQSRIGTEIDHCFVSYGEFGEGLVLGSWPRQLNLKGWKKTDGIPAEIDIDIEAKQLHRWPEFHQILNDGQVNLKTRIRSENDKVQLTGNLTGSNLGFDLFIDHEDLAFNIASSFRLDDETWSCEYQIEQGLDQHIKGTFNTVSPGSLLDPAVIIKNTDKLINNVSGQLIAQDIHFKIKGSVPRIGDINGQIQLAQGKISTEHLSATLGYEPVIINGFIQVGYPHVKSCDVQVQGSRVLLVQSPSLRLRTDCNLRVHKDETHPLSLKGKVKIIDALYTEEFITTARHTPEVDSQFQLFELPESFLGGAQLDLEVSAKKSIRIRNSMLRADASGELRIRGTGMVPEPSGEVLIHQDSRLSLPFSNIWFNPSTITFKASEPFDPYFTINGRSKMQGYDLRIILEGKMSDFSVNGIDIVSNPPISPEEATRLITTGIPPRKISDTGKDIDTSGLVIGWAIVETLRKVFGNDDYSRESFFDEIEVQIGRDVSRNGYNTIEVISPIPSTENMYLKIERDKYEDYNGMMIWRAEW